MIMHDKSVLGCGSGVEGGVCGCVCTIVELKHSFLLKPSINKSKWHIHLTQNTDNLRLS